MGVIDTEADREKQIHEFECGANAKRDLRGHKA